MMSVDEHAEAANFGTVMYLVVKAQRRHSACILLVVEQALAVNHAGKCSIYQGSPICRLWRFLHCSGLETEGSVEEFHA